MIYHIKKRHYLMLLVVLFTAVSNAEPKQESAGQQALKKAQGVVRQLTEEKRALETEKADLLEQLKKLLVIVRQLEPLPAVVQQQKEQSESLRTANTTLESQLLSEREKQQNLQRKLKEIVAEAKLIQNDNQLLVEAVNEREHWISLCSDKNKQLIEANHGLVIKYQDKSFWDKVAEIEPFTGIAKVETQNTVESYQFKLDDLKVTAFKSELPDTQAQRPKKEAPDVGSDHQKK